MRLKITTVTVIDTDTGGVESKSTWTVEGADSGLGAPLLQALARLRERVVPEAVVATAVEPPTPNAATQERQVNQARHVAGLVGLPDDELQAAIDTRPIARVIDVLKWIQQKRTKGPIKSTTALFWSVVVKD